MMILADASSFLGSLWFSALALVVGYVVGNVVPFAALTAMLKRKG